MTEPRYILLTVKKITVPTRGGQAQSTFVQPMLRKLFVMPIAINMEQHGRAAELDVGSGMVLTMAEDFNDVLIAIEEAQRNGVYIVRPFARGVIESAASSVVPFKTAQEDLEEALLREALPIAEAVIDGAKDFARRVEGDKHQGERWDDFPVPGVRPVKAGDLRIVELDAPGRFWIEICATDRDDATDDAIFEWTRSGVPGDLLAVHETREAARQAVKLSGYARRLIED